MLSVVQKAKTTGKVTEIDQIVVETTFSDFWSETSKFTSHFLDQCDYQGVPASKVQSKNFTKVDIKTLDNLARELGTRRPRDRAAFYLSAAKIVSLLESEDRNYFFKYLCRSFASRGDASVIENRHLD